VFSNPPERSIEIFGTQHQRRACSEHSELAPRRRTRAYSRRPFRRVQRESAMTDEYLPLGASVANARIGDASGAAQEAIEQGVRASLLCTLFGVEREQWVWPFPALARSEAARSGVTVRMLASLLEPLGGIGRLGTAAGASDLDPMDPGPAHTVLPATLAACVAHEAGDAGAGTDETVRSAVLAGVEAAWAFRCAITGTRPGVGFHSPGVYGTLAAAASGARMLGLDAAACANALAIALTRASGLATNSAATTIGLTHFGWGALHGLEAALLASQGWDASHDFRRGLATLFGEDRVAPERLNAPGSTAAESLVFKRYPCNIYLNLLVAILEDVEGGPVDRIDVALPWVPHLDNPAPRDLRQARNSAQAAAAIAGAGDISYAAFSGPPGPWQPRPEVARLLPNVHLTMDKDAPTGLKNAVVSVRAWRSGRVVLDAERAMRDLRGWGVEHARRLAGADGAAGVREIYGDSHLRAFAAIRARLDSGAATRAALTGHRG